MDYFAVYMADLETIDAPDWDDVTRGSMSSQPEYWNGTTGQRTSPKYNYTSRNRNRR